MQNKKEKKGMGIAGSIFLLLLFAVMSVAYTISEKDYLFSSEPSDLTKLSDGELKKGMYASVTIDNNNVSVIDWFAETKHYVNGIIPIGKERHCILFYSGPQGKPALISLTVKGKDNIEKIDKVIDYIYDSTYSIAKPADLTFEGQISSMDSEISKYYREASGKFLDLAEEYGYGGDSYQVYELTLDASQTKLGAFGILGFCILMVIISIWFLVSAIKTKKAEKLAAMSPAASYNAAAGTGMSEPYNGFNNPPFMGDEEKTMLLNPENDNNNNL